MAKSLQTSTIAMHRAKPIMIKPTMYSGMSLSSKIARRNIRIGPITQFCSKDNSITFQSLNTRPNFSYFTLASGGYIMTIKPIAIGMEVVPTCMRERNSEKFGIKVPRNSPRAIEAKIHTVKYRSRKDNLRVPGKFFTILLFWL
ncbi:hypothetical protein D3C76_1146320 [compost metagenome]